MSFKTLENITNDLIASYPASKEWDDSPFNWIRGLPPASKGAIGRDIGSGLLYAYGFTPSSHRYELRVNGQGVVVRVAMKWKGNIVKFQNLRNNEFEHIFCIALYPKSAYAWLIPKSEVWHNDAVRNDRAGVTMQHKGADAWLSIDPKKVPEWMKPYGGTIDDMMKVAKTSL